MTSCKLCVILLISFITIIMTKYCCRRLQQICTASTQ